MDGLDADDQPLGCENIATGKYSGFTIAGFAERQSAAPRGVGIIKRASTSNAKLRLDQHRLARRLIWLAAQGE